MDRLVHRWVDRVGRVIHLVPTSCLVLHPSQVLGQTDSQVAKSRKFHAYTIDLRSTCVDLRWVAKRWNTCADLRTNLSSTKVHASQCKWVAKPNASWTQVETCVDLRVRLTRASLFLVLAESIIIFQKGMCFQWFQSVRLETWPAPVLQTCASTCESVWPGLKKSASPGSSAPRVMITDRELTTLDSCANASGNYHSLGKIVANSLTDKNIFRLALTLGWG